MRNKNFLNRLHGYWLHYHPKLTRTWLALFAVTLIVVSFALGGLKSGPDDGAAVSTVVDIDLPERDVFQPAQDDAFVPGQQDLPSAEDEPWQQVVVSSGPYRYVRHPNYIGSIFNAIGTALALQSVWALVPGGLVAVLLILRTGLEDRTLQKELPGYREYARRVRWKLLPGIW